MFTTPWESMPPDHSNSSTNIVLRQKVFYAEVIAIYVHRKYK